ncbi:major facilitator superfamily domain-containing protein [Syncephalastrum racemosum]|uniref:Major facilitator superfamily domain-containing protein n=1 Tax=Syncephalastrum racemosum TaxID=13706 RepID=A0A1X2GZ44_SYNRA|nr:major facilitator superfamily domain-containing protein [Syncephalastrum racemosum]
MPLVTRNVAPDPKLLPHSHKYLILLTVSVAGCLSPMATTIYLPALIDMQEAFDTSDTAMNASLALFIFVTAFFPLIWAAFGDAIGRRPIYLISIFIAVIANVGCALSTNVVMLIVFRAVTGIGSSSVMSMGAGSISDIFEAEERGRAFAYYTTGPMLGPALAPIIGGYLNLAFGWQSNFWFLAIAFFCVWLGILCFLPETWRPKASPQASVKSGRASRKTKKASVRVINPLVAVKLLRYPNVVLVVLFSGFFANFSRIYTEQYKLDTGTVGLCYLPQAIGSIVGGNTGGRLSDKTYKRRIHSVDKSKIYPEMRINGPFLYFAFVLQLFAQIAYGWCIQMNVHYAVGLVCLFFGN